MEESQLNFLFPGTYSVLLDRTRRQVGRCTCIWKEVTIVGQHDFRLARAGKGSKTKVYHIHTSLPLESVEINSAVKWFTEPVIMFQPCFFLSTDCHGSCNRSDRHSFITFLMTRGQRTHSRFSTNVDRHLPLGLQSEFSSALKYVLFSDR